jgi:Ca-activated chloride channel family protein
LLLSAVAFPQTATFTTDVNLVTVNVHVTDRQGRDVNGLDKSSFTLLEDGKPQQIAVFQPEAQPVSLGVLLDTSQSMRAGGKLANAKAALSALIVSGHPGNEIFFMEFSDKLGAVIDLTGDHLQIPPVSNAMASRGTALYDAIAVALCRLRSARYPRHALIVVTDGADQHSRLKLDELVRSIQSSDAQVYIVGDFTAEEKEVFELRHNSVTLVSGHSIDNPLIAFERLAQESGAESYFPATPTQLKRAVEAVAKELQTQYTLGYYLQTSAKSYRRIEVRVLGHRFNVQARHGWGAADPGVHFRSDTCEISAEAHPYPYERKLSRQNGRLVYHEDFADPKSGWPFRESSWYGNGEYHLSFSRQVGTDAGDEGTLSAYGPWWSDFQASVSLKLSMAPARNAGTRTLPAAGLVFRLNDRGYYALLISNLTGGRPVHAKLIAKEFRASSVELMPWKSVVDADQGQVGEWKNLRVECRGNSIVAYVDGREAGRVKDARFPSGHIGLAQFGAGHAVFRDLLVSE